MYTVLPTGKIAETETSIIIGLGSRQLVVSKDKREYYKEILEAVQFGLSEADANFIKEKDFNFRDAFDALERGGVISSKRLTTSKADGIRYKSSLYLNCFANDVESVSGRMEQTTILVIGCGGIGNHVAYSLSSFNIKKMILIDGDTIDETNLNRQFLFGVEDIGKPKVNAIAKKIQSLRPDLDIQTYNDFVKSDILTKILDETSGPAVAVLSGDSEDLLLNICPILIENRVPFLNVGYLNDISVIGPFWTGTEDACPFCFNDLGVQEDLSSEDSLSNYCSGYQAPSCMVNNSFAGAMAVSDIINFWSGDKSHIKSINKRVGFANPTFEILNVPLRVDSHCPVCSSINHHDK